MSPYLLAGPAVALIGIVAIVFVMRHKSTEQRSMYSSRRSQIQRKVQAARSRTLAPHGRSSKAPTDSEIAAAAPMAAPTFEAPVAPRQAWEVGPATSAPAFAAPPAAPPAFAPPPYTPPAAEPAAPAFEPGPAQAPVEEPSWTPAPAEPAWTPSAAPEPATPAPAPAAPAAQPEPVSTPAGGGASWEIVGADSVPEIQERAPKSKDKKKEKHAAAATGGAWSLASGDAPSGEGGDEEVAKAPNPAMAVAQYAVLVVGLVMVLIGVLVMVANSKVT